MDRNQIEAVGAICVLAALADGSMSDRERERVRASFEGPDGAAAGDGEEARALAAAYRRAMLGQADVETEARALGSELGSEELRRYAFEMAVAVCDADGPQSERERAFLDKLRGSLGLSAADAGAVTAQADELAEIELAAPPVHAPAPVAAAAPEVDGSILKYSILNGALELLPQGIATMAIVPLQMKMVYGVGKAHGVSLDRGHIKEFIATVGVGMTSQVVENFARDFLGGLAKKFLGKTAGRIVGTATGPVMTFATTYALGQVARQYYAGGRKLSAIDLRALFGREFERAKGLYEQHRPQIEETARTVDPRQLLSMVRGA